MTAPTASQFKLRQFILLPKSDRLLATGVAWSTWLLISSMFIFLSPASLERFQELQALRGQQQPPVKGCSHTTGGLDLVTRLGVASGFPAVLVPALYVNSEHVLKL